MPAVAWLRQNTIGSLPRRIGRAAGRHRARRRRAECRCAAARSANADAHHAGADRAAPARRRRRRVGRMPASRNACSAAASAKRCERLANLSSLRSAPSAASSKPFTSAAMRVGKPLASKSVIGAAPLRPASSASHVVATSLPTGVTRPMPVIATRRFVPAHASSLPASSTPRGGDALAVDMRAERDLASTPSAGGAQLGGDARARWPGRDERAHLHVRHARRARRRRRGASASPRAASSHARGRSAHRAAASPETPGGAENDRRRTAPSCGTVQRRAQPTSPGTRSTTSTSRGAHAAKAARRRAARRAAARSARAAPPANRTRRPAASGRGSRLSSITRLPSTVAAAAVGDRIVVAVVDVDVELERARPAATSPLEARLGGERRDRPAAKVDVRHRDPRRELADRLGDEARRKRGDVARARRTRRARASPGANSVMRSTNENAAK